MTTRIGKNEAKVLEGVALNLFTDTREIIVQASGVMDAIYRRCKAVVQGREQAHVKYLLSCYKQLVNDDPSISAAKGTVDQITAAINKLVREGLELPESYAQARRLAYPPKQSAPRGPRLESGDEEGEGTATTTGEAAARSEGTPVSARVAQMIHLLREMDEAGFDWSWAEAAVKDTYAGFQFEKMIARDAADSEDMAEEA